MLDMIDASLGIPFTWADSLEEAEVQIKDISDNYSVVLAIIDRESVPWLLLCECDVEQHIAVFCKSHLIYDLLRRKVFYDWEVHAHGLWTSTNSAKTTRTPKVNLISVPRRSDELSKRLRNLRILPFSIHS